MQSTDALLSCHGCSEKFSLPHLFYNKDTKQLLCGGCRNGNDQLTMPRKQTLAPTGPRVRTEQDLIRYVCRSCSYAFSKTQDRTPKGCPYCESKELDIDVALQKDKEKEKFLMDLYG